MNVVRSLKAAGIVQLPGTEYGALAEAHGIGRLGPDEPRAQEAIIRKGLRFSGAPPTLARYDIEEFLY